MRSYTQKNRNINKSRKSKSRVSKKRVNLSKKRKQNGGVFGRGKTKKRLTALEKKVDGISGTLSEIIKVVNFNKGNVRELAKQVRGMLSLPGVKRVSRSNSFNTNNVRRRL